MKMNVLFVVAAVGLGVATCALGKKGPEATGGYRVRHGYHSKSPQ